MRCLHLLSGGLDPSLREGTAVGPAPSPCCRDDTVTFRLLCSLESWLWHIGVSVSSVSSGTFFGPVVLVLGSNLLCCLPPASQLSLWLELSHTRCCPLSTGWSRLLEDLVGPAAKYMGLALPQCTGDSFLISSLVVVHLKRKVILSVNIEIFDKVQQNMSTQKLKSGAR